MVGDNLVKLILTEWLVLFGTKAVTYDEAQYYMGDVIFKHYPDNHIWQHMIEEERYILYDPHAMTWQLTDAGVKHLQ
jgi:hypothetical protein